MSTTESKYIDKSDYLSRYSHERMVGLREAQAHAPIGSESEWLKTLQQELPRFIPFLTDKCGVEFRGRILEIGAGGAWLSAELSKLPRVVEIVVTDFSPKLLKEEAPKVFRLLKANSAKITRLPADFHQLGFPDNHFDYVVSSAVLHDATNMVQALREVKRVLKPGGQFVAIREPVSPLMKLKSRSRTVQGSGASVREGDYTLSNYKEYFKQAGLPLEIKRVNISSGFKYYVNALINGLTHARYAFIGRKKSAAKTSRPHHGTLAVGRAAARTRKPH